MQPNNACNALKIIPYRLLIILEKKSHTLKVLVISKPQKTIGYLSYAVEGKRHDYTLLQDCFPPDKRWFEKHTLQVDLAFMGIKGKYKLDNVNIPNKKSKNTELTVNQKKENKTLAKNRIGVEHAIGGMKRYRILVDRLRIKDIDLYNIILEVCAGLWNLNIFYRSIKNALCFMRQ